MDRRFGIGCSEFNGIRSACLAIRFRALFSDFIAAARGRDRLKV